MECKRCGNCCRTAFLALNNIAIDKDEKEIGRLFSYHRCDISVYGKEKTLGITIPISCVHLVYDSDKEKYCCKIYETRPIVCKEYFCDKVKQESEIVDLMRKEGIDV